MMEQVDENKVIKIGGKMLSLQNRRCRKKTLSKYMYPSNCLRRISFMLTSLETDKIALNKELPTDVTNVLNASLNQTVDRLKHTHSILKMAIRLSNKLDREGIEIDRNNNSRSLITRKYLILDNNEIIRISQSGLSIGLMEPIINQTTERVELSPLVSETVNLCDFFESPELTQTISDTIERQNTNVSLPMMDNMLKTTTTTDEPVELVCYTQANDYYDDVYTLAKRDSCVSIFQSESLTNNGQCRESTSVINSK